MTDSRQITAQKKLAMTRSKADRHTQLCVNIFSYKGVIEGTLIDLMDERVVPSIRRQR
jgi:hypothetical protein